MTKPTTKSSAPPGLVVTEQDIAGSHDPHGARVQMKTTLMVAYCIETASHQIATTVARSASAITGTMILCAVFLKWC